MASCHQFNGSAAVSAFGRTTLKRCRYADVEEDYVAVKRLCSGSPSDGQMAADVNNNNNIATNNNPDNGKSNSSNHVYHAVYLDYPTRRHLVEKLSSLYNIESGHVTSVNVEATSGVFVVVTDTVVQNLGDQSKFGIELNQDEEQPGKYHILLKAEGSSAL
jgi:hypothetical protein